jgi:hypothetical protein
MAATVSAGEWCCEHSIDVLSGGIDPKIDCKNMGNWDVNKVSQKEFYECALLDVFHGFNYDLVLTHPNSEYTKKYKHLVSALPIAYDRVPEVRDTIRKYIFEGHFFLDSENKVIFDKLMKGTSDEKAWDALVEAANNVPGGKAKAFYQWCNNNGVSYYIWNVHHLTLEEIIQTQTKPKLDNFDGNIRCRWSQDYVYEKIETNILRNKSVKIEYLRLLIKKNLWLLRNTIFAKYGRRFENPELQEWFGKRKWYKSNPAYSEGFLSKQDKKLIAAIVALESEQPDSE